MGASLGFLEVDPFGDRQGLELAVHGGEAELDSAEAHPIAAPDDASAAGDASRLGRNRDADGAAEVDPVGAVVEVDQNGKGVRGAGLLSYGARRDLGGLFGDFHDRTFETD